MGLADDGLPLGLQIVARPHDEAMSVRVGNSIEKALPRNRAALVKCLSGSR